jgi:hypothetical protein
MSAKKVTTILNWCWKKKSEWFKKLWKNQWDSKDKKIVSFLNKIKEQKLLYILSDKNDHKI